MGTHSYIVWCSVRAGGRWVVFVRTVENCSCRIGPLLIATLNSLSYTRVYSLINMPSEYIKLHARATSPRLISYVKFYTPGSWPAFGIRTA